MSDAEGREGESRGEVVYLCFPAARSHFGAIVAELA